MTRHQTGGGGGTSSAGSFNINSDPLLRKLEDHPNRFRYGHINISADMVADDLALISPSRYEMQALVNIAEQDASSRVRWRGLPKQYTNRVICRRNTT